jgi:hypothetical protein
MAANASALLSCLRYFRNSGRGSASRYIIRMQTMRYVCRQCEREEPQCECDRYCSLCFGADNVRLCEDGGYYCMNCRESCDFTAQDGNF